jgi:hypothetical protein
MFDLSMVDTCAPPPSTSDSAIKGKRVRVLRDFNRQSGMWHSVSGSRALPAVGLTAGPVQLLYYRRTRPGRRDAPILSDIQLFPSGVTPAGDGNWVKAPRSLCDGVVRALALFL